MCSEIDLDKIMQLLKEQGVKPPFEIHLTKGQKAAICNRTPRERWEGQELNMVVWGDE